jgi:FkbM family methyltransferase
VTSSAEREMNPATDFVHFAGRGLRKAGRTLMDWHALRGIWFDVGAYRCEHTYGYALYNPSLLVYAFEPNMQLAAQMFGALPNMIIVPMAVSETDGCAEFNITATAASSSLLAIDDDNARRWVGGSQNSISVVSKTVVPTIRLDTFMNFAGIQTVDYLKIDAQGSDLAVVKSLGNRLKDLRKIYLEVSVTPNPVYRGEATKTEVVEFLQGRGFDLVAAEPQSDAQEENLTFTNRAAHV